MHNIKKYYRIGSHVIFWFVVLAFYGIYGGLYDYDFKKSFYMLAFTLPLDIANLYFNLYILVNKLLLKKKYFTFAVCFVLTAICILIIERALNHYWIVPHFYPQYFSKPTSYFWNFSHILSLGIHIYAVVIFAISLKLLKQWYYEHQQKTELIIQNKTSELALLRMQINPHFLFNTLNNIHTLIRLNPENAENSLARLSDIMRYMLYETNTEKVLLEKEINYMKAYIELNKLRLVKPEIVKIEIIGEPANKTIAPMIFIPFVENAFKHSDKQNHQPGICICLEIKEKDIVFNIKNAISTIKTNYHSGGIGLQNIQRRLQLLYSGNHELNIIDDNKIFNVTLTIHLL